MIKLTLIWPPRDISRIAGFSRKTGLFSLTTLQSLPHYHTPRAVGRSKHPGGQVVCGGNNLHPPFPVELICQNSGDTAICPPDPLGSRITTHHSTTILEFYGLHPFWQLPKWVQISALKVKMAVYVHTYMYARLICTLRSDLKGTL